MATAPLKLPFLSALGDSAMMRQMVVPLCVLAIVIALITPVPPLVLDLLVALDIMMSVIVLMVALYIKKPADFSVFPTTLLLLTLLRLTLNISASRLILMHGATGTKAAGSVIEAFGNFVVGGNYVIGAVIFLMLLAIQFVVINHGAVRISEVTARFTLDALPGKQMSIDSDLNAGMIDESEAKKRRKQLAQEAEFYGAMDGASRFTQRDALAAALTTGINIIGGFLIGVLQNGMELGKAVETFTVLTIGDGLVTVIPALMVSIAGALIVTRTSSDDPVGSDFQLQIFGNAAPLLLSAGVLLVLAAIPGLPKIPFILVGATLGAFAWKKHKREESATKEAAAPKKMVETAQSIERLIEVEPILIEVGVSLVQQIRASGNNSLMARVSGIRKQAATELGITLPSIRFSDNLSLRSREYVVRLKGAEISRYELPTNMELGLPSGTSPADLDGVPTNEPAFGMPALWLSPHNVAEARREGYTVIDSVSVMATHILELVRRHSYELFSRQDAKRLLDRIAIDNSRAVEDLVPKLLPLAVVHKVLQNLLRERVGIRDGVTILESLGEAALSTKNAVLLTEFVRQALRRTVVEPYANPGGGLPAFFLSPTLEEEISVAVEHGEHNSQLRLAPPQIRELLGKLVSTVGSPKAPVVVVTGSGARFFLQQLVEQVLPNVFFLSHGEIPPATRIISLGVVE